MYAYDSHVKVREAMALRQGNRQQMEFLPPSVEQYIPDEASVRAYDAFVEALDFNKLGISTDRLKEGNPRYDPKAMLKLVVYGYSYGVRSSRKLERETHYNLSFIWLMGGLKPDHKTIAEFRRRHKEALKKALVQCVRLCLKLDLVAGNILFVDGSKIRGNASIKNTWTAEKCQRVLQKVEKATTGTTCACESAKRKGGCWRSSESVVALGLHSGQKTGILSLASDSSGGESVGGEVFHIRAGGETPSRLLGSRINYEKPGCTSWCPRPSGQTRMMYDGTPIKSG